MRFLLTLVVSLIVGVVAGLSSSNNNNMVKKVAVVGGTGRLGRQAVDMLLARDVGVKCLIRSSLPPEYMQTMQQKYSPDKLEFVKGDITDANALTTLLDGCSACLALHGATRKSKLTDILPGNVEDTDMSHPKQVNYLAMSLLLSAARNSKTCSHIIRITGKGESPFSFFSILINGLGSMAKGWNYEGEQILRKADDIDYTIIRPGVMKEDFVEPEDVQLDLADNGADLKVSVVAYKQIAELCVESIFTPAARRTTLTAMNVETTTSKTSLLERLQKVQKDTRNFPESLIDEHKRAVSTTFAAVGAVLLLTLLSIIFSF